MPEVGPELHREHGDGAGDDHGPGVAGEDQRDRQQHVDREQDERLDDGRAGAHGVHHGAERELLPGGAQPRAHQRQVHRREGEVQQPFVVVDGGEVRARRGRGEGRGHHALDGVVLHVRRGVGAEADGGQDAQAAAAQRRRHLVEQLPAQADPRILVPLLAVGPPVGRRAGVLGVPRWAVDPALDRRGRTVAVVVARGLAVDVGAEPLGIAPAVGGEQRGDVGLLPVVLGARRDEAVLQELAELLEQHRVLDAGLVELHAVAGEVRHAAEPRDGRVRRAGRKRHHAVPPDGYVGVGEDRGEGAVVGGARGARGHRRAGAAGLLVAEHAGAQGDEGLRGQHHHRQRQRDVDLHAPHRGGARILGLHAHGRADEVLGQDEQERDEHDPGVRQHAPQVVVLLPAEQRGEQLEVGLDGHDTRPLTNLPARFCTSSSSITTSQAAARQRCAATYRRCASLQP